MPTAITAASLDAVTLVKRLTDEGLIGMNAAARIYGEAKEGKPPHASTPTRHAITGTRLSDGRVLKLEMIRIAGRLMTSRAAVLRFFAAQNESADVPFAPTAPTPRQRNRAQTAASAEVDAILN